MLLVLWYSSFCQDNKTKNFDFAVQLIEENYAGFSSKVVQSTTEDYEQLKYRLREQLKLDLKESNDAIGEYISWFKDHHLGYDPYCLKYMGNYRFYKEIEYDPQAIYTKIDNQTYLIRVPSFDGKPSLAWINRSIKSYLASGCENLILDIRGNGGGSDIFIEPYVELLYDKPGFIYGVEVRNTKRYQIEVKQMSRRFNFLKDVYQTMLNTDDQFVTLVASDSVKYDKTSQYPLKAAVIIDKYVASSGEGFLVQLLASSSRTTIYGKDNTLGCCDFSNCTYVTIPGTSNSIQLPMTRSLGLAYGFNIDKEGISPEVRLDLPLPHRLTDNVDEWVLWIANNLKQSHSK